MHRCFLILLLIGMQVSGEVVKQVFKASDGTALPYTLQTPDAVRPEEKLPLVLCLHGAGGRGTDNAGRGSQAFRQLSFAEVQAQYPSYLLIPQCPMGEQWVDVPWAKGSYDLSRVPCSNELKAVRELLDVVCAEFNIDSSRLYVTGQSMGGYGTWDMILRNPDLFASAIPVCGAGDPSEAAEICDLPIWIFHGSDDPAVPVTGSREMAEALQEEGSTAVRYTEYPGVGHGSWVNAWKEPTLVPWLFSQKKD